MFPDFIACNSATKFIRAASFMKIDPPVSKPEDKDSFLHVLDGLTRQQYSDLTTALQQLGFAEKAVRASTVTACLTKVLVVAKLVDKYATPTNLNKGGSCRLSRALRPASHHRWVGV